MPKRASTILSIRSDPLLLIPRASSVAITRGSGSSRVTPYRSRGGADGLRAVESQGVARRSPTEERRRGSIASIACGMPALVGIHCGSLLSVSLPHSQLWLPHSQSCSQSCALEYPVRARCTPQLLWMGGVDGQCRWGDRAVRMGSVKGGVNERCE